MNVGNYGNTYVFGTGFAGAGFDMSGNTNLTLTFTRPDMTTLTVESPDVVLGAAPYTLPDGQVFAANQYVTYTFVDGDVTVAGLWRARLTYDKDNVSPPLHYTSDIGNFTVGL